jgi:2Fe-2S ferredoxin
MPELIVITREGEEVSIDGRTGMPVMELIRAAGVDELLALCGGCCSCATCHVFVDPVFHHRLMPMEAEENDLLDSSAHRKAESRLSCQLKFTDELAGLRVTIAPED